MKIMDKKVLVASLLMVSSIIALFAALNLARAQPLTVGVDPSALSVYVCENFEINVVVSNVGDPGLSDYDFMLTYDSSQMTPINAVDGAFLEPPLVDFGWDTAIPDKVHVWGVSGDPVPPGAMGNGILATITFHCDAPGASMLTFVIDEVWLSDPFENYFHPEDVGWGTIIQQDVGAAHTYIAPATYTVPICVPFTVNVMAQDVTDLYSFSLVLSYDTASVDCFDIVDGGFLPPPTTETHKLIDEAAGKIEFDLQSEAASGATGTGAIATITFHCTGPGESILNIDSITLWNSAGFVIPTTTAGGRVIQIAYWEPVKLIDIVEWPGIVIYRDIPFAPPASPVGYAEIKAELEDKGYWFDDPTTGIAMEVEGSIEESKFTGTVTSHWSSNTLGDGTRACLLSAEMDDGTSIAMGFATNLLPPEQVPGVDPHIIVNAMPYMYVRFYWYAWPSDVYPLGRVITWPYWWYDSHSHPNWFWGPYWWWRVYTKAYFLGMPYPPVDINWAYWRPWWGWWWNWVYWRHWYWWSTYFPYDP